MYYPEFANCNEEVIPPNPYGLPPDPIIEQNENQYDNLYFNTVIKEMYHKHKNTTLFPVIINTSKSMEITNLNPILPSKSQSKKAPKRHKSDPTKETELKKNHSLKNSKKEKKNSKRNKESSHNNSSRNVSDTN